MSETEINTFNCSLCTMPEESMTNFDCNNMILNYKVGSKYQVLPEKQGSNPDLSLQMENELLKKKLNEEQQRSTKYQKKVIYIQEHVGILNQIKQAYLSLKYNESTGRPLIDIKEEGSQTPTVTLKRSDLDAVKESLISLKEYVDNRPHIVLKDEREIKYRKDIITLFKEKLHLKQIIKDQQTELDDINKNLLDKQLPIDCSALKKIIAKLNINLRHLGIEPIVNLTDMESKIVKHITAKYQIKIEQKKHLEKKMSASDLSGQL